MKSKASWKKVALLIYLLFLACAATAWAQAIPGGQPQGGSGNPPDINVGYLENVTFSKVAAKERMTIQVSRQSGVNVEAAAANSVIVKLDNILVPDEFKKPIGEGQLNNIVRVLPVQKSSGGKTWAALTIELKARVPYSVKQEGNNIIIDFNVSALVYKDSAAFTGPAPTGTVSGDQRILAVPKDRAERKEPLSSARADKDAGPMGGQAAGSQRISVDFQDADIRAVLRLLSEQSGKNIVASPEVKGTLTINMKNVPWDQVLDTILNISGLLKAEEANVITVMTIDKVKKDELERRTAEENRVKTEEVMRVTKKKTMAERGKAKQLMIEAKIVEVSDTFTRGLGVQWGGSYQGTFGNSGYSYGAVGGTTPLTSSLTKLTTGVSLTPDALALNFPSSALSPSIGIIMGGANAVLNARISALETTAQGKVISTPRVLISDDEKAIIEQGEQIPVITPATANTPASTTYKDAVLRLEVTPLIISDDYVLLTVQAKNDRANRAEKDPTTGNMPIFTSKVDSKVAVKDGDTIVIGGVKRTEDNKAVSGVPWLARIPLLGWLFKTEDIAQTSRELLIFVTPRIIRKTETQETAKK